jgi:hypothetical protein
VRVSLEAEHGGGALQPVQAPGMIQILGDSGGPRSIADDALKTLGKLCDNSMTEVTVVAASDAGVVGILAHSVLELVGKPMDRFLVLDVRPPAKAGSLFEVPTILAERPLPSIPSYQELAASRRLARRRLLEPEMLVLDGARLTIGIDDIVLPVPRLQFFWMFCLATLAPKAFPLHVLCGNFQIEADGRITVVSEHPQRGHVAMLIQHIKRVFITLFPEAADDFPSVFKRACGPTPGLPSVIAKLNAHVKRALGAGADRYLVSGGRRGGGYRLTLLPTQIKLVPPVRIASPAQREGPIEAARSRGGGVRRPS